MKKVLFSLLLMSAVASVAMEDDSSAKGINDLTPEQAKESLVKLLESIEKSKQVVPSDTLTVALLQQRANGEIVKVDGCSIQ